MGAAWTGCGRRSGPCCGGEVGDGPAAGAPPRTKHSSPGPGTPERPRPDRAAPRLPLCPAPGAPVRAGQQPAATAPAHRRFSVPQGRPPLPGRWRRASGCMEALGLTQGKQAVPGPAMASGSACPALAGEGPRHSVLRTWGRAARRAERPQDRRLPAARLPCVQYCPLTSLQKGRNPPPNLFSFPPTSWFVSPLPPEPALSAQRPALPRGTSLQLVRAMSGRRRRRSGAGYAGLFLSRPCT